MHALQIISIAAVLAVGFGAKHVLFPDTKEDANRGAVQSASLNIRQGSFDPQIANRLPVEKIDDMTFVDPQKE